MAEVVTFHNGKAPPKDEGTEYPVYGSNGKIGRSSHFNHETAVIVGRVGAYCGSVELCTEKFWASDNAIVVKPKDGVDLRFLHYRLKSVRLNALAGGAAQPLLTQGVLKLYLIEVPKHSTQVKIASILSAYDDLIENNQRRVALLEEAVQQLYKEWFVRFRFPDHELIPIIDGVPEGWERKTLGEIATTNEASHNARELPELVNYIDISAVNKGWINSKAMMPAFEAPSRARRIAKHGDIIWSNVRPNLKAYALVYEPEDNDVFSTGFTILSAKTVPFIFLYQAVTTDAFVAHLVNHTTGASYPAVRALDFERANLVVPPNPLLKQFEDACLPTYIQIGILKRLSSELAKARDLLLPKLMNGEIVV